eukprot:UN03716
MRKAGMKRDILNQVLNEAKVLSGIPDHPNICRFIGMINDKENIAIVTEYIANGSVSDCLENYEFTVADKYNILRQCAAGVWALHRVNYIHRDLALRNALTDLRSFRVVITDFGMSRLLDAKSKNQTKNRVLPIAWSAPEALKATKYSTKTDIWSFGVMAWELFST